MLRNHFWRLQLPMSGALGGKLGKPLLACTSPVGAGRCGSLRVLHPGGREGPAGRAPGCAARRAPTTVQSEGSAPKGKKHTDGTRSNKRQCTDMEHGAPKGIRRATGQIFESSAVCFA